MALTSYYSIIEKQNIKSYTLCNHIYMKKKEGLVEADSRKMEKAVASWRGKTGITPYCNSNM